MLEHDYLNVVLVDCCWDKNKQYRGTQTRIDLDTGNTGTHRLLDLPGKLLSDGSCCRKGVVVGKEGCQKGGVVQNGVVVKKELFIRKELVRRSCL